MNFDSHIKIPMARKTRTSTSWRRSARQIIQALGLVVGGGVVAAPAPPQEPALPVAPLRGELLYANHCITCHTAQVHWREQRLVNNWDSLLTQVRRWQGNAQLGWSESDMEEVAKHLNRRYYRFKSPTVGG
jgi:hypothetical protein